MSPRTGRPTEKTKIGGIGISRFPLKITLSWLAEYDSVCCNKAIHEQRQCLYDIGMSGQ